MANRKRTPWGVANLATERGPGVWFYSTPSHGGFKLSHGSGQRIPERFRTQREGWPDWYEEDCEASIVVAYFPELFTTEERTRALESLAHWYPHIRETIAA